MPESLRSLLSGPCLASHGATHVQSNCDAWCMVKEAGQYDQDVTLCDAHAAAL